MCGTFFSLQAIDHGEGLAIVPYRFDGSIFEIAIIAHLVLLFSGLSAVVILCYEFLFGPRTSLCVTVPEPAGQVLGEADNTASNVAASIKELQHLPVLVFGAIAQSGSSVGIDQSS